MEQCKTPSSVDSMEQCKTPSSEDSAVEQRMKMTSTYECSACGRTFSTKQNCVRHEKTHSELSDDKFFCPECDRGFSRKHDLCRHIIAKHNDMSLGSHLCSICGINFARKGLLKKHMEVHGDSKKRRYSSKNPSDKFDCHFCAVSFKTKKYLQKHILAHSKKRKEQIDGGNSPETVATIESLEPFLSVKKNRKKKLDIMEFDEVQLSNMADGESEEFVIDVGYDLVHENDEGYPTAEVRPKLWDKNLSNHQSKIKEPSPDQFVIDYVKSKMIEMHQESHRQQFLLSLLPDVREMSNNQFRSFRQQVCSLIDRILQPDLATLQAGSTLLTESSSVGNQQCLLSET